MEELFIRRNSNVANKASSNRGVSVRITDESEEVNIAIPDPEASSNSSGDSQKHRIERIPPLMRRDKRNKRYYYPQVVSLGPYHHGKKKLKLVEDFKPRVLQMFVSNSGNHRDDFYNAVLEVIEDARSCYVQGSTDAYNDEAFANMMLLDGCFILHYIDCLDHGNDWDTWYDHLGSLTTSILFFDLLLLENQLPFQVLQVLMSLKFKENEGGKLINRFLDMTTSGVLLSHNKDEVAVAEDESQQPLHLFEAFRKRKLSKRGELNLHTTLRSLCDRWSKKFYEVSQHLLHTKSHVRHNVVDYIHSFRSVKELKAKGIFVKPSSISLHDVRFKSYWFYGQLELPIFFIDWNTKRWFLNNIAYEMCPRKPNELEITSYVAFMKSLIDHPADVKELRSKRILINTLGSDKEVVKMFKEINTCDVHDPFAYAEVRDSIQNHYNSAARTSMAELYFTYFSSPWKTIALLGGILLLALTILQTYSSSWKDIKRK